MVPVDETDELRRLVRESLPSSSSSSSSSRLRFSDSLSGGICVIGAVSLGDGVSGVSSSDLDPWGVFGVANSDEGILMSIASSSSSG